MVTLLLVFLIFYLVKNRTVKAKHVNTIYQTKINFNSARFKNGFKKFAKAFVYIMLLCMYAPILILVLFIL